MAKDRIILTGGGTGGHVYPLVELAKELSDKYEVYYVGLGNEFEKRAFRSLKIIHKPIISGKFRRNIGIKSVFLNIIDAFKLAAGIFQSFFIIVTIRPKLIFSKGGYVALPMCLAAYVTRAKLVIHESDTVFGLTNRISARFADRVLVGFPVDAYEKKYAKRAVRVGVPIKESFFAHNKAGRQGTVLVIGGSSGAVMLNEMIFAIGKKILSKYKLIHLVGEKNLKEALDFREGIEEKFKKKYLPIAYSNEVDGLIKKSDLVVSRSGATAIFEVLAAQKPLVLVPISPTVAYHQTVNAAYCEMIGAAKLVSQIDKPTKLLQAIEKMLSDGNKHKMQNILAMKKSAKKIAEIINDELNEELKKYKKIHLIGASGVSMKLISRILSRLGKRVTGSDLKFGGHAASNVAQDVDLVVYSSAAGVNSPAKVEHDQAHRYNIEVIKRSKMIAMLGQNKSVVSVAGMHGKTTTSSIISRIFRFAGYEPSFLIGAESTKGNPTAGFSRYGEHLILEACEYDGSFLDFRSEAAVITNIELEHLDYFKQGMKSIQAAFSAFISNIRDGGALVYCADDKNIVSIIEKNKQQLDDRSIKLISYGHDETRNYVVTKSKIDGGISFFDVKSKNGDVKVRTMVPGDHFALDCSAALALSRHFGIPDGYILDAIGTFTGADRRFSCVGSFGNILVMDDYAHHPTEISSTVEALRMSNHDKKIALVFQPHQQKRFDDFYNDFLKVFYTSGADLVILLPVFKIAGRDSKEIRSSQDLAGDLVSRGFKALYAADYQQAVKILLQRCQNEKYAVMTMGATEVYKVGKKLLEDIKIEKKFDK